MLHWCFCRFPGGYVLPKATATETRCLRTNEDFKAMRAASYSITERDRDASLSAQRLHGFMAVIVRHIEKPFLQLVSIEPFH